MEEKGWVASTTVIQEGKPNKRVYSITDSGREAFSNWMRSPALLFENRHSPFKMYMFFGADAPQETLNRIKAVRDGLTVALEEQCQEMQSNINKFKESFEDGENESFYWEMLLDLATAEAEALLKWTEKYAKILEDKTL